MTNKASYRLTDRLRLHLRLHFDLHHGQHDGAVVAFGQRADDGAGRLLDLSSIAVLRPSVLLEGLRQRHREESADLFHGLFKSCVLNIHNHTF